jgi:hypothetical protein
MNDLSPSCCFPTNHRARNRHWDPRNYPPNRPSTRESPGIKPPNPEPDISLCFLCFLCFSSAFSLRFLCFSSAFRLSFLCLPLPSTFVRATPLFQFRFRFRFWLRDLTWLTTTRKINKGWTRPLHFLTTDLQNHLKNHQELLLLSRWFVPSRNHKESQGSSLSSKELSRASRKHVHTIW